VVAVSSPGLHPVIAAGAEYAPPNAVWVLATKGWQSGTLLTPSQVAAKVLGDAAPVVALAGPGIAAEIVVGSQTALLCASHDPEARRLVARTLRWRMLRSPSSWPHGTRSTCRRRVRWISRCAKS
jgi:glycerol-3-phosphate dehydrogenase (NAD(P)+)